MPLLYSIIETPAHPDLSALYQKLGIRQLRLPSQRKAIAQLKRQTPDWVVAEFLYGYGNNYAGVNISNLDVFLHSQRKYAPTARVIVLAGARDRSTRRNWVAYCERDECATRCSPGGWTPLLMTLKSEFRSLIRQSIQVYFRITPWKPESTAY